jgi:hypothetical protein
MQAEQEAHAQETATGKPGTSAKERMAANVKVWTAVIAAISIWINPTWIELGDAAHSAGSGYLAERMRCWTTLGSLSPSCYRHAAGVLE